MPSVISISIGKSSFMLVKGRGLVKSAINKHPINTKIKITELGLEGDEQADKHAHGGIDQAVYVYPIEHYPFWGEQLPYGYFGENLTISGLVESDVYVDDVWKINDVKLQVTRARTPCLKFNSKMKSVTAAKDMIQSGKTGWYLRVLNVGTIQINDKITVIPGPRKHAISLQSYEGWTAK